MTLIWAETISDKVIIEYLVGEYKKQEGIDISKDTLALQRLRETERAKHELSTAAERNKSALRHFRFFGPKI